MSCQNSLCPVFLSPAPPLAACTCPLPVPGTVSVRLRIEITLRQSSAEVSKRSGFCPVDQPTVREMVDDADDTMFSLLLISSNHVLHQLMPPSRNTSYDLRPRHHDFSLTHKPNKIVDTDFIIRMLFRNSY